MNNINRYNFIDIAKMLGIVLMFIGHRASGNVQNFIYLFHMPLFFILSGLVIKEKEYKTIKDVILSEKKLIIAYCFYSFAFIIFNFIEDMYYGSTAGLLFKTITLYGIDSMWFFSCLFLCKVFAKSINKIKDTKIRNIIVILIYVIAFFLSLKMRSFEYEDLKMRIIKYLTFSILRFGNCLIFVYVGFIYKNKIMKFIKDIDFKKFYCWLFFAICVALLIVGSDLPRADYHTLRNGVFVITTVLAFVGFFTIIFISKFIDEQLKPIGDLAGKIGKESMHLMTMEHFHLHKYIFILCGFVCSDENARALVSVFILITILMALSLYVFPLIDRLISKISCLF